MVVILLTLVILVSNEKTFLQDFLVILQNFEEIFTRYYMHSDMFSMYLIMHMKRMIQNTPHA